ncbi:MAG: gliding motility-associated C-terminal domain-containing protein [Bacteroidota bacterium]
MDTTSTYRILITSLLLCFTSLGFAQQGNDECENAIPLPEVANWCSANGTYNNAMGTPSGFGPASCFAGTEDDVWFSFVAIATDVVITVKGNTSIAPGGTLVNPQAALYQGNCLGTLNELECANSIQEANIIELYQGGIVVGQTYYLRVQAASGNNGTFQICVDNFNPPVLPGSDCVDASVLCDKNSFVVQQVIGSGDDPLEAVNSSCLGGFGAGSEANSTWFSWIAANDGSLTFVISPLNISDDLDFILYELPSGVNNCDDKVELRCMASGDFPVNFPSPCLGPTGLRVGETDLSEPSGCSNPTQNSFLAPIMMEEGKAYALMINNFSNTGNGFAIEFGGDGEFLGPQAIIQASAPTVCFGEQLTLTDASIFQLGNITNWQWNFGLGADPATANVAGPHVVAWDSPGTKFIALTVGTDLGCQLTTVLNIEVEPCCTAINNMTVDAQLTELLCPTIPDGAIDLTVSSNAPGHTYLWSTGATSEDIMGLALGEYQVTITNEATCDTVITYSIGAPLGINVQEEIIMPQCMGGLDGGIILNVSGGIPPYQYNWGSGFTSDNTLLDIGVGIYTVTVQDANDCQQVIDYDVRELELVLDSNLPVVTPPSCFDTFDGQVSFTVSNGTPPYLFDYNDGNGFVSTNLLTGLNAGTFNVTFQDAAGCMGDTLVVVMPPSPVAVATNPINVSCFGEGDGIAEVSPSGGVGNYTYLWDDPALQTDSIATGLEPGVYRVTVADGNGCSTTGSVAITQPDELFLEVVNVENVLCFGDTSGSITVLGTGGNPGYQYSIDDEITFQQDTTFRDVSAGTYEIIVADQLGCTASVMATITEPAELIVDAGRDTTVELGFPVSINTVVFPFFRPVTYEWSPVADLNCEDCPRVEALAPNTSIYQVTVTDETGCTAVDSIMVSVLKVRPVYVPNAFSPNADGVNDFFTAFAGPAASQIRQLSVFNRWGAVVYEARNIPLNEERFGWDGLFKGQVLPPDVFAYYLVVDFIDGETLEYEGDITIIK